MTADDLGLCASVSDGIFDAHRHGIVRAASLFVVGEDAKRAARLSQREATLRVGIHLALVDGKPCTPRDEVPSLVDENGSFPGSYARFVRRYLTGRIQISEVEREWRAQIERAISWGITPAHLDSHQHLHLLPGLFELALRLGRDYAVPRLRVPGSRDSLLSTVKAMLRQDFKPGQAALELLSLRAAKKLTRAADVHMCDRFLGRNESCRLSQDALLMLIDQVQPGTQELMCHPGQSDEDALRRYAFGENWGRELAALTSAAVRARIAERGIVLIGSLSDRCEAA